MHLNLNSAIVVLAVLVAIQGAVGHGTVSLTNMVPQSWTDHIKAWCNFLAFCGSTIMGALAVPGAIHGLVVAAVAGVLMFGGPAHAADVATKAPALSYNYPTTKCGMYYGVNTMGSTGAVENSAVGTQAVQAGIGLTLGYTCPVGPGYWFADASADFANLNGSANGLSLTGPAMFEERFGFGAPIDMIMSLVPGLSSLQNAVPSLIPLPSGVGVVTSSPYVFGSFHQDDVGVANGLASNKEFLLSAGFGIGTKTRLSNGVVFDPFAEYILPSSAVCLGPLGGNLCYHQSSQVRVGAILEF